ncbi:hypothetical protein PH210_28955 [Paenibacillus sp. BSR1-1]|uniref:hypothetical protein n=1 Tax=Paenibacillus sp. BSR1-1 TaxID=3020845 RepID=UPI0025B1A405|nr:hypothetical protein [Paenibacillus sp. BSR1-1]MDN3020176.1 hypothetical protein [Paenibacillus sp. BSR1-1]
MSKRGILIFLIVLTILVIIIEVWIFGGWVPFIYRLLSNTQELALYFIAVMSVFIVGRLGKIISLLEENKRKDGE